MLNAFRNHFLARRVSNLMKKTLINKITFLLIGLSLPGKSYSSDINDFITQLTTHIGGSNIIKILMPPEVSNLPPEYTMHFLARAHYCHPLLTNMRNEECFLFMTKAAEHYADNFSNFLVDRRGEYNTPISLLFCSLERNWSYKRMVRVLGLIEIFQEYESLIPKVFKQIDINSLLHTVIKHHHAKTPLIEIEPFRMHFKEIFESQIPESMDEDFLKYAYVFFKVTEPEHPLLESILSKAKPLDTKVHMNQIQEALVDNPYILLENLLEGIDGWRICMDFGKQRTGEYWVDYELVEKGTIPSLLDGFRYLLETKDQPISLEYLKNLYAKATKHHQDKYNTRGFGFGVLGNNRTLAFFHEIETKYSEIAELSIGSDPTANFVLPIYMKHLDNVEDVMNGFIETYEAAISGDDKTLEDKIIASIELSHALIILHPNRDCNTRTYVTLLLNRLLMDLGVPPYGF